jgi:hypothetical protein|tara:strand:- start:141 stop:383 length:243 start_codon:yes stop_codon:yes gene_type:complete
MFINNIHFPRSFAVFSVQKLAEVDYTVANRVSDDVANIVTWSYDHNFPWLANYAIESLQNLDNFGSILISIVVWIIHHTN